VLWQYLAGASAGSGALAMIAREYFKYRRMRLWFDFHRWAYTQSNDASVLLQAGQVREVLGGPVAEDKVKSLPSPGPRKRSPKQPPSVA
jgi:hypothetical protein